MHELPVAITRSDLSGLTWVALEGELDLGGVGLVGDDLHRICERCAHVVIDARGLRFVDLAGLRLLVDVGRRQRERGARISLVPGPLVTRLARLADMTSVLEGDDDPQILLGFAASSSPGPSP